MILQFNCSLAQILSAVYIGYPVINPRLIQALSPRDKPNCSVSFFKRPIL
ncbi:hypothetical protein RHORCCE3_0227 [Rickettsia hoogstraalii str. RCCE3]|nr:hypothetical protein RHORCCE3_0227 [Rickettsia hoogstraalii str. RCCE3]